MRRSQEILMDWYSMSPSAFTRAIHGLTYREREIVRLCVGHDDGYTYTLQEIGRIFKVTRERVRNIEARATRKLPRLLRDELNRKEQGCKSQPK